MGKELKDDPIYQERLAKGLVSMTPKDETEKVISPEAKRSVYIFALAIGCVVFYATAISDTVGLIKEPVLGRDHAIISFMLAAATLITFFCKVEAKKSLPPPLFNPV